jgi:type IV pilus assembly protein PilQ
MSVSTEGDETRIHVMLDEPVEFSHFTLNDPARLFLDCRGVDTVLPKSLPGGQGRAGAIEASVWQGTGRHSMARITIDLARPSDASVEQAEGGLIVTLQSKSSTDWAPETAQAVDVDEPTHAEVEDDVLTSADDLDGLDELRASDEASEPEATGTSEASTSPVPASSSQESTDAIELESAEATGSEAAPVEEAMESSGASSAEEAVEGTEPSSDEEATEPSNAPEPVMVESPFDAADAGASEEVDVLEGLDLEDTASPEETLDYELPEETPYQEYYERAAGSTVTSIGVQEEDGLAARGGARVSLDIQGADIYTVLRSISEYSGVNIVMGYDVPEEISEPLAFHLENVPWGEALEMVLRSAHLWYREEGNIIRVDTEENLRNEELARSNAARQLEEVMPLSTRIVEVVYANAAEMKPTLERTLSRRGVIDVDHRTNSILITDIRPRVEAAVDMIQHLDSQTPQIEIVAKLVDVDARFSRDLGVIWGVGGVHSNEGVSLEGVVGANDVLDPTAIVRFGVVRSWGTVSAVLSAMERENKANIISNPRVTTVNNRTARILVGKKIPLIVLDEAGNAVTELVTIGISLRVTPHINDQNRITLDLHPEVSDLSSQATVQGGVIINTSEADTRVMVDNGETAVIGGLIRSNKVNLVRGVPILKDIPLVGSLFKNTSEVQEKRELLIFVTPRILSSLANSGD